MPENRPRNLAAALLFMSVLSAIGSRAMGQSVSEDDIISLANAPAVLSTQGTVDEAGRPALNLTLSFANDCLAKTGAVVKIARTQGGTNFAILTQRINIDGCPDIFRPVQMRVRILLPGSLAGETIHLVAKPASGNRLRQIALTGGDKDTPSADQIIEARYIGGGSTLPAFDLDRTTPSEAGPGYVLSGKVALNPDCAANRLNATVYEIPDGNGAPRSDAVLISAAPNCLMPAPQTQLNLHIGTPQPLAGRSVFVLNAGAVPAISLSR